MVVGFAIVLSPAPGAHRTREIRHEACLLQALTS
jgi:hypothetical protein